MRVTSQKNVRGKFLPSCRFFSNMQMGSGEHPELDAIGPPGFQICEKDVFVDSLILKRTLSVKYNCTLTESHGAHMRLENTGVE